MKKTLFLIIFSASFYCNGQSITLSPGSSAFPFTIKSGGTSTGYYGDISTSATSGLQYYYVSATTSSLGTDVGNIFGSASRFGMNSNTSLILRTASADRMTILNNGYVGIGFSTPNATLDVARGTAGWGTATFRGTNHNSHFSFDVAEDTYIRGGKNTSNVVISDLGNTVSVGAYPAASYILEVHNKSAFGLGLYSTANTSRWELFVPAVANGNLDLYGNNNYRGGFNGTTGVYTSVSDKTLKNNIAAMGNVLDKVLQLQPSTYSFIDNNPTNKTSIGFIAQDVELLFPEFVYKNTMKDGSEIRSMDYAGMSVIALKAIQEQQVLIKELQAEIAKLKNK